MSNLRPGQKNRKLTTYTRTHQYTCIEFRSGRRHADRPTTIISLSEGYENFIAAIEVSSRSAFAYPVPSPTAVNTTKVIIDIMTRHAYLSTVRRSEKDSVFVSNVIHEIADVLGITLHMQPRSMQNLSQSSKERMPR